jgi:hypothetical protein
VANPYLDIGRYVHLQLKEDKRTPIRLALIYSLLSPLDENFNNISQFLADKLRELGYNGQTIQLERLLNDKFDSTLRRIFIRHSIFDFDFLFYVEEEQIESFLFYDTELGFNGTFGTSGLVGEEQFYYNLGENPGSLNDGISSTSGDWVDFEIVVPTSLFSFEPQIIANTNKYRQAGFVYRIVYV